MLILTRRKGQRIQIGKDIMVVVADVREDKRRGGYEVRIGIEAPKDIDIMRDDVIHGKHDGIKDRSGNR